MSSYREKFTPEQLSVTISELLVATADRSDPLLEVPLGELLKTLRRQIGLDVVFVSEFVDGQRVFRFVDSEPGAPELQPGASDALEQSYCQRVVDGRLPPLMHDAAALPPGSVPAAPYRVGGFLSSPITLRSGEVCGTLCCFSTQPRPELREQDLLTLQRAAVLVARRLEVGERSEQATAFGATEWHLEPRP